MNSGKENKHNQFIAQFSLECCKTKTKVITPTNHNRCKQSNELIRTQRKYMSPVINAGKYVQASCNNYIGFGFTFDWMRKWREMF